MRFPACITVPALLRPVAPLVLLAVLAACEESPLRPEPEAEDPDRGVVSLPMPAFSYGSLTFGLLITPTGLDFGRVAVGTTAPTQVVTITNIAAVPITMSGAGGAPPSGLFGGSQNCQGVTLNPDESCQMSFAFSPNAPGPVTDASVGNWNGQDFDIGLRGEGVGPEFLITPSSLDFGEVVVGETAPTQTVTITNAGLAPVVMNGAGGAPPSGRFGGSQNCQGITLDPGASCQMSFAFSPNAPGLLTDASVGNWNGQSFDIALHGVGVGPSFVITPTALEFGEVTVGTTSPAQTVNITNISAVPVVMNGAGGAPPSGRFGGSQNCQGVTLIPGASCEMSFAFSPNALGDLTDASIGNWNGQAFDIALHGTGLAPGAPRADPFLITPEALDFGDVVVGSVAPVQMVHITNVSAAPVVVNGAGGAPPSGRFGGSQNCQGITLDPGESCSMSFAFAPTAAGVLTDASVGNWNGQAFNIALRGNGVAPKFLITPTGLDFGDVQVGSTSPTQMVTITNQNSVAIVMNGAGGAPPSGRFGGSQSCQGASLDPGASCTMSFAFSPNAAGVLTDASVGNWNGQPFNIALQGNGVGPRFRITPFGLDFGLVPVDMTAAAQMVTITNTGLDAVVMNGAGGAPPSGLFGGSQNCQGLTLAIGDSCEMTFAFAPVAVGPVMDASVGNWNGQPFDVALMGEGFLDILTVDTDIKPGSDPNSIQCTNDEEPIAVAILTTSDFDATTVDHRTVMFEGAGEIHVDRKTGEPRRHEEDVDGDGDMDLVLHFRLGDTVLTCGSTEGTLAGVTFDGQDIAGTDFVRMVDGLD